MTPTLYALPVLLLGLLLPLRQLPGAMLLAALFGATAAVEIGALGGAPVTPAALLMPLIAARVLLAAPRRDASSPPRGIDAVLQQFTPPSAGFWLLLLVLWGVAGALLLPRLFAGETLLYATDRQAIAGVRLVPLQPLPTNLSQSAYALAGLAVFATLATLLRDAATRRAFADAALAVAALNVLAALLNLAELHLGLPSLLEGVRNAGYALLVGGELGGLTRISGTFAEASAFATFTVPLFAFVLTLARRGWRPPVSGTLAAALLVLLLLSTSSTAYVALAVYAALLGAAAAWRALTGPQQLRLGLPGLLLWFGGVVLCLVVLLRPEWFDRVHELVSVTLLRKLESSSGIERSSWNLQAWQNFVDLHGIGAGLGSARASSFVLALLSNLGIPGALLFGAFALRLLWPRRGALQPGVPGADAVAHAARHAVLGALLAASVSSAMFDLGLAFYAFAAAAAAAPRALARPRAAEVRHAAA